MKRFLILLIAVWTFPLTQAQQLAAFNDFMERFWVFDGGQFQQLEYLQIQDYQIGGLVLAYIDGGDNLKIYRNGKVETLITGRPIKYNATDYLLGYSIYEQLNVWDNGDTKVLSMEAGEYLIRDSLVAWYNKRRQTIQVYYDETIYTIEDALIYDPITRAKAGDNTLAYIQPSTRELKLFYRGEVQVLYPFVEDLVYEAGRDIVAFMDVQNMAFNVFYKGELITLEPFMPKSFQVGDEILVYVDNLGRLKYFEGGEPVEISPYEPRFYDLVDRTLVFEEQGFFKTYCNNQIYIVERFIPEVYRIDWNTIAYLDQSRFLKAFQHCEHVSVTNAIVRELMLFRDLIVFVENVNQPKVFFLGQVFEY